MTVKQTIRKPRNLGLMLWYLVYRVPVLDKLTDAWVLKAREHCRMSSERYQKLQDPEYAIHWNRMRGRRQRRLEYYQENGSVPDGWSPPGPGEPDRSKQVAAMKLHRKLLAPKRALFRKMKQGKDKRFWAWHTKRYLRSRKIRNRAERLAELDVLEALMFERVLADKLTLEDFQDLGSIIEMDRKQSKKGHKSKKA